MVKSELKNVTVIIPAYNEEMGIEETLEKLKKIVSNNSYELIVVDDRSEDQTAKIASSFDMVNLVKHATNKGYGAALKTGINKSISDIICITDADGTYPNDKIPYLVNQLLENDLDMVVGARTGDHVKIPFVRKPAKWVIGKLANYITSQHIPDINSGLRVFRKKSFMPFYNIVPQGFSFTTTITLGMLSGGYKVKFIPIDYFRRSGKSKIRPIMDTLNFFKLILRIGLYFSPLKIFMPLSIGLLIIAFGWGIFTKFILGELADVSLLIIAMTGFQFAALAFLAELINHRLPNQYNK